MCGVPFRGGGGVIYDTESAPGGKVHGRYGAVASTDWSRRSRGSAGFILKRLHELSILLFGGSGLFIFDVFLERFRLDYGAGSLSLVM